MDIDKLLKQAASFCDMAITTPAPYLLADRITFAQIADACAHVAYVMIEYERWQEERLKAERAEMLARRESEPPF